MEKERTRSVRDGFARARRCETGMVLLMGLDRHQARSTFGAAVISITGLLTSAHGQCEPVWLKASGVPGVEVDYGVEAVCTWSPDGAGPRLVVGGGITAAGDRVVKNIAVFDGEQWSSLGALPNRVSALADHHGTLVAGVVPNLEPVPTPSVYQWDGAGWQTLGGSEWPIGQIRAMQVLGDDLYAGGGFTFCGAKQVNGIARWDGQAWHAVGAGLNVGVQSLVVHQGQLYAAGTIAARWDGTSWTQLPGTGWSWLAVHDGELIACTINGKNLSRWNGATWTTLSNKSPFATVRSMLSHKGTLYAAGEVAMDNSPLLGRWTSDGWQTDDNGLYGVYVGALAEYQNKMIAGGWITYGMSGDNKVVELQNIGQWDADTQAWAPLPEEGVAHPWWTVALAPFENGFVMATSGYVAKFETGHRVLHKAGEGLEQTSQLGGVFNSAIRTAVNHQGELIIGGDFLTHDDKPLAHVAAWDGRAWTQAGVEAFPANVRVLHSTGSRLFAASESGAAELVGDSWVMKGSNKFIAMASDGDDVMAAEFMRAYRLIGDTWQSLGGPFQTPAHSLAAFDGQWYVGLSTGVARWDGQAWTLVGQLADPCVDLTATGQSLTALTYKQGVYRVHHLQNGQWIPIGEPAFSANPNASLVASSNELIVNGKLSFPDGRYQAPFARLGCDCQADCDHSGSLDIDDFVCFQTLLAIGDSGADCDASGELDIDDFVCFQTRFAIGC